VLHDLVRNLLDIALNLSISELAADETLGSEEGVLGVDNGLALGGDTNEALALFSEADDGWCGAATWTESACLVWVEMARHVPSEFSMMRGTLPSMTATAELVVPRSIPITEPLTFSSPPSAYPRTNLEPMGALMAGARHAAEVARGKNCHDVSILVVGERKRRQPTARDNLEDIILCMCVGRCRSGRWKQQGTECEAIERWEDLLYDELGGEALTGGQKSVEEFRKL
jgi:hypothetical protein